MCVPVDVYLIKKKDFKFKILNVKNPHVLIIDIVLIRQMKNRDESNKKMQKKTLKTRKILYILIVKKKEVQLHN